MHTNQHGMATAEYLIVLLFLIVTLLAPVVNGKTAIVAIMDALKDLYAGWAYVISSSVFS